VAPFFVPAIQGRRGLMKSFLVRYGRLLAVVLFLGALLTLFEMSGLGNHFDLEALRHRIQENQIRGLLLLILLFALGNLLHVPGWVFLAAAVLTLGRTWGGMAIYVAASISCVLTFVIIRFVGGDALRQLKNRLAVRMLRQLDAQPITSIALLRVVFQTAPALNYALAMSGVRFRQYIIGTLLGLPLPIALYCLFFDYLARVLHVL
jgi:uncharacterized membrane protein YdjX (TVP38/TMEM64 family)